jgi:hypothetical protein
MRKGLSIFAAMLLVFATSFSALADVSDYLSGGAKSSRCPRTIVVRPEMSQKTIFYPVDSSNLDTASKMIGSAVAGKYDGAMVIAPSDLEQYKSCDVPVVLAKLKSYTKDPAIFGQYEGKATISILHFRSPSSNSPDRETQVSATGERHWGDDVPFMNAMQAVAEKIQKTSF